MSKKPKHKQQFEKVWLPPAGVLSNLELMRQLRAVEDQLQQAERANQQFAREKARRTDQFKALLQVANLLLVVASNEIVRMESDYDRPGATAS